MTAAVAKHKVRLARLIFGSLVGSLYLFALFFEPFALLYTWYGKIALSIAMILTTFGLQRPAMVCKFLLIFFAVSFLFGGGIFALSFLLQGQQSTLDGLIIMEDAFVYPQASLLTLIVGYIVMILLSRYYFQSIEIGKRRTQFILSCKIRIFDYEVNVQGLLDSGNQLFEPMTRIPVIVLEAEYVRSFLPSSLIQAIEQRIDDVVWFDYLPAEWQERIRIIPYRGMGSGNQMMIAIIPDFVLILDGDKQYITKRVRVGLTKQTLSAEGAYQAILHPSLIREEAIQKQSDEEVHYAKEMAP